MTVQREVNKNVYVGDGVTNVFPITFEYNDDYPEYIHVYVRKNNGALVATNDYYLDKKENTITYPFSKENPALLEPGFLDPLLPGETIVIRRELPLTQPMNLVNQGPFFADSIEQGLDDLVMMVQQLAENTARSITVELDSSDNPNDVVGEIFNARNEAQMFSEQAVVSAAASLQSEQNAAASETMSGQNKAATEQNRTAVEQAKSEVDTSLSQVLSHEEIVLGYMNAAAGSASQARAFEDSSRVNAATSNEAAALAVNKASEASASKEAAANSEIKANEYQNLAKQYADGMINIPVGAIVSFAGADEIPVGFLVCDGASVMRGTYPQLFRIIGTTYGAEDEAHFNLPDLRDRFVEGTEENTGEYKEPGLPNIWGKSNFGSSACFLDRGSNGAIYTVDEMSNGVPSPTSTKYNVAKNFEFDASRSNAIYGASDTVQPKALMLRYIIRAFASHNEEAKDITITQVMNELNRIDAKLNDLKNVDVVVESDGDENLWYRKYKSGWLEQGGMYYQESATREINHVFDLLKPFRNNIYTVTVTAGDERSTTTAWSFAPSSNCLSESSLLAHVYGIGTSDVAKRINFFAFGWGAD